MWMVRKRPISGILAALACVAIARATWADDFRAMLPNGIGADASHRPLGGTSDHVRIVKVQRLTAEDQIAITLCIDSGFHINANPASLPYLIPTSVSFAGMHPYRLGYPVPIRFRPKFTDEPLDVYEGTVVIAASFKKGVLDAAPVVTATVTAQACTDQICLPPADLRILSFRAGP